MSKKVKLIALNALLAGFWSALGYFNASEGQQLSRAFVFGAVAVGGRAVIGYIVQALTDLRDVSDVALK